MCHQTLWPQTKTPSRVLQAANGAPYEGDEADDGAPYDDEFQEHLHHE